MLSIRVFIAAAACSSMIISVGYAAALRFVDGQLETTAAAVVNKAAKQDRLEIARPVMGFRAEHFRDN